MLLGLVPPQLFSPHPWIAYCSVHVVLSAIIGGFGLPLNGKLLDTVFPALDAATRSGAIIAGVNMVRSHPNPAVANSLFAQLIFGAIGSAGGGAVAATLGAWNSDWALSTPPFLKAGTGVLPTLEIWSGALAAALYGTLLNLHPSYEPVYGAVGMQAKPVVTPLGARSAVVLLLTLLYYVKVVAMHYLPKSQPIKQRVAVIKKMQ